MNCVYLAQDPHAVSVEKVPVILISGRMRNLSSALTHHPLGEQWAAAVLHPGGNHWVIEPPQKSNPEY